MERVKYDPEIDPSIREEAEEAERERELSARIRIEIERYAREQEEAEEKPDEEEPEEEEEDEKDRERRLKREEKIERKAKRAAGSKRAFQSIFTGSILSSEQIRKMYPYLIGLAVVLLLYIANVFHLQRLHRTHQKLEAEIKELRIKSVGYAAERTQKTQRSAIVERLDAYGIPLHESTTPVKVIDGR